MIKVEKDPTQIPASLDSKLTKKRRNELIAKAAYIYEKIYDSRYKMPDVKKKLDAIYSGKCAFCEQNVEAFHVDHFRPKSIYYWLAYSWDNLLYICASCNTAKSKHFATQKKQIFKIEDLENIHSLAAKYAEEEQNNFIHPELEDIEKLVDFDDKGKISSLNKRVQYTIDTCQLNRDRLTERRKAVFNDFEQKYNDKRLNYLLTGDKIDLGKLIGFIADFEENTKKSATEFRLFRSFIIAYFLKSKK